MFLYSTVSTLKPVAEAMHAAVSPWIWTWLPRSKPCLTNGGDGGDNLAQLQLVQNGGLACSVEADLLGSAAGGTSQDR